MNAEPDFSKSIQRLERSRRSLAGGTSSGMRSAYKPVPLFFESGTGSHLLDVDGNEFIDYTLAWGPLILGHCSVAINEAVMAQMRKLQQVGAQHDLEWEVAEQVCRLVPCADQVVFSNTGTEAVQIAFRLARAHTRRNKIIRFEGHYHGWMDNVLIGYRPPVDSDVAASAARPTGGMSEAATGEVITLPWNDLEVVERTLRERGNEIAGIITEPILCNSSCLLPLPKYLQGLRELATRYGVVLIFDEVITGFRVALGGAQSLFGVIPDLATFGKAIAGGFSLSAVGGRRDIMRLIEQHRVIHSGTFNGNAVSLAAARAVLDRLESNSGAVLAQIRKYGETLIEGIRALSSEAEIPILVNGVGSVFHISFTNRREMHTYREACDVDNVTRDAWLEAMLSLGIYLLPDGRWYLSAAHTSADVQHTLNMIRRALIEIRNRPNGAKDGAMKACRVT